MEVFTTTIQVPCFASGTPLRQGSPVWSRQSRGRPIVAIAGQPQTKGIDRRTTLATLAGILAGVSFPRLSNAAIDSSALLERYEKNKRESRGGTAALKKPVNPAKKPVSQPISQTPGPAPRRTTSSVGGTSPQSATALLGGAAAIVVGALALGGYSGQGSGKSLAARPSRSGTMIVGTRVVGTRPIARRPAPNTKPALKRLPTKKPSAPKRVVTPKPKPKPSRRAPSAARSVPKQKLRPAQRATRSRPGEKASAGSSGLSGVVGFGLAVATALILFNPYAGQKMEKKTAKSSNIPKAVVVKPKPPMPPPQIVTPQKPVAPPAAGPKPAAKEPPAPPPVAAPKPAVKAEPPMEKPKSAPVSAAKQKTEKTKPVVGLAPVKKQAETPASTLALGLFALAAAGSAAYFLGGKESKTTAAPAPLKPEEKPEEVEKPAATSATTEAKEQDNGLEVAAKDGSELSPEEELEKRRQEATEWIDNWRKRSKKGFFGFMKK